MSYVLKDRNGSPITYEGVKKLTLPTGDGTKHIFSNTVYAAETLRVNGGRFKADSNKMTISHNLGAVPDYIFVGRLDVADHVSRNGGQIAWAMGWSRRIKDAEGRFLYGLANTVCIDEPDGEDNVNYGRYTSDTGIDEYHEYDYGMIREANSKTFVVGTDDPKTRYFYMHQNAQYFWLAVSGLGVRMNEVSEV